MSIARVYPYCSCGMAMYPVSSWRDEAWQVLYFECLNDHRWPVRKEEDRVEFGAYYEAEKKAPPKGPAFQIVAESQPPTQLAADGPTSCTGGEGQGSGKH